MSMLEGLLQTLNHYAIVVMSFTGQSFVDSAKTGCVVVFSHPELFAVLSSVRSFLMISGVLFLGGIPTLTSVLLSKVMGMGEADVAVGMFTFITSLIIACFFLCTLSETIVSMFTFYCMDRQLQVYGVRDLPPAGTQPYSYDHLVNQNLSDLTPVGMMTAAYPYVSGEAPGYTSGSHPYGPVIPG